VTDVQQWTEAVDVVQSVFGTPDVLVKDAGILQFAPMLSMSVADFDRVLQVNLVGPFLGMKSVGAVMTGARSGSIVNITSTGGWWGCR
jgi:3alpha(or 20beta)-hydroxysteroid dehydrogenase